MRRTLGSRLAQTIALSAMSAVVATAQTTARGTAFTMHVKITAVGDGPMATAMQAQQAEWRGTGIGLGSRGRIDIVEGGQPPVMQQGDFMLFAGADAVAVNPTNKTFLLMQGATMTGEAVMSRVGMTFKNVSVKLDTLGAGETIEGRQTQRFRLAVSYLLSMTEASDGPQILTTQTTDFWIANIADLPATPFTRTTPPNAKGAGPMTELTDRLVATMAGLPRGGVAVRQIAAGRFTMSGATFGLDNTTEMSDIKQADVDLDRLVLPSGFTQRTLPGFPPPDSTSSAAADKWRTRPTPN